MKTKSPWSTAKNPSLVTPLSVTDSTGVMLENLDNPPPGCVLNVGWLPKLSRRNPAPFILAAAVTICQSYFTLVGKVAVLATMISPKPTAVAIFTAEVAAGAAPNSINCLGPKAGKPFMAKVPDVSVASVIKPTSGGKVSCWLMTISPTTGVL